jgi:hypothetical protein
MDAISLSFHKEMAKEKEPRRSPWEPPPLPLYKEKQERSHESI